MIGLTVRIKTKKFEGNVKILDKRMTNMAHYSKSAIMNNASLEVYVGVYEELDALDVECPLIEFLPEEVTEICLK